MLVYMGLGLQSFLEKRLQRGVFTGLPLTLFTLLLCILLATFVGITTAIVDSGPIVRIDASFAQFLFHLRTPLLAQVFYDITALANQATIVVLGAAAVLYLYFKKERGYLHALILILIGTETSVYFTKILIARPRPLADIAYYIETSASFPSGHSAIAVAFFGFVTYYLGLHSARRGAKSLVLIAGTLLIFAIGFSRLYLGVHYLSDVLGGFLIGGLWLTVGITFREHHFYSNSIKKEKDKSI